MRGIAFTNLVVVPCRVSLLPVTRFEMHYETPPVETRALDCAKNPKTEEHQSCPRRLPRPETALFSRKSNALQMKLSKKIKASCSYTVVTNVVAYVRMMPKSGRDPEGELLFLRTIDCST